MKKYINLCFLLLFLGCSDDIFYDGGISLSILNYTDVAYENATLYIGAIKNSNFIVTDSLSSNGPVNGKNDNETFVKTELTVGTFGWTPELNKIERNSQNGAFLLILKDGPKLFFEPFYFPKPKLDGISLSVNIISGELSTLENDLIEKQGFEIVK